MSTTRTSQHIVGGSKKRRRIESESDYVPEDDSGDEKDATDLAPDAILDVPHNSSELLRQTTEIIEGTVLLTAKKITEELTAPYDTSLYADVFYELALREVGDLGINVRLERNVAVPVVVAGRHFGNVKLQFLYRTSSGRPMLALDIKTKKGALKNGDMDGLRAAVEQLGHQTARARGAEEVQDDRPKAMLLNFSGGTAASMVMDRDGTVAD